VFSVGHALTDTAAGPSRRQFFCEEARDFRDDGTGVPFRLNSPGKIVDPNSSLLVPFVFVVSTPRMVACDSVESHRWGRGDYQGEE